MKAVITNNEMDKMLENEKANEKVVAFDEWRKAS